MSVILLFIWILDSHFLTLRQLWIFYTIELSLLFIILFFHNPNKVVSGMSKYLLNSKNLISIFSREFILLTYSIKLFQFNHSFLSLTINERLSQHTTKNNREKLEYNHLNFSHKLLTVWLPDTIYLSSGGCL